MINTFFLTLSFLATIANATPCADGWESSSSGSGTCSHHGGIAGGSSGYYPTYSPTYATPSHPAPKVDWVISSVELLNFPGVVQRSATKFGEKVGLRYSCLLDSDQTPLFLEFSVLIDSATGCWSSDVGKKFSVSVGSGNSAVAIKSWKVDCRDDIVLLTKIMSTGEIFKSIPDQLIAEEVKLFKTADYIRFTVNETAYSLSLAGSAAAIAATDAACNR